MFAPWELELIASCRVAHLGTIAADGRPHLVPVCFAYVQGRFAIAIDEKPKLGVKLARIANIERDRRVTLLFDRYDDDWARLAWLRVDGEAALRGRGDSWPQALAGLRDRYVQYNTMLLESLPLIEIVPAKSASWRWRGG